MFATSTSIDRTIGEPSLLILVVTQQVNPRDTLCCPWGLQMQAENRSPSIGEMGSAGLYLRHLGALVNLS